MSNRLDQEREQKLEPIRLKIALNKLKDLKCIEVLSNTKKEIKFLYKDQECIYFPYSGWASGKSIKAGRGLSNLLKQLV